MKKRQLLGLMLLMTATAASAEWTRVGSNDDFIQYVDRATIRRDGNLVKMWGLKTFKAVQPGTDGYPYLSTKVQSEYDCKEEKSRILAFSHFSGQMGNGKVGLFDNDIGEKWSPISPGSADESLWKIACGKK